MIIVIAVKASVCGPGGAVQVNVDGDDGAVLLPPLHNVYFVKYNVAISFMAQVLDTVTYFVPQVLDTAS